MGSVLLQVRVCLPAGLCVFGRVSFHSESSADLGKLKSSSQMVSHPSFLLLFLLILSLLLLTNPLPGQRDLHSFVENEAK